MPCAEEGKRYQIEESKSRSTNGVYFYDPKDQFWRKILLSIMKKNQSCVKAVKVMFVCSSRPVRTIFIKVISLRPKV